MSWTDPLRKVLRLDEEELSLWPRIAAAEPSEGVRGIIQVMIEREKREMEDLRAMIRHYGGYDDPPMY
ncbi:MAG: hypothetical protein H5U02_05330 [Clostridia bacterium]|nr:hypothetical protein [Clostridia bacterium]